MVKSFQLMSSVVPVLAVKFADQQVLLQLAQMKQHNEAEHMASTANTMQTQIELLLEKAVASGEPVVNAHDSTGLGAAGNGGSVYSLMKSALDTIESQLGTENTENQADWDAANAAITACNTAKNTAFSAAAGVSTKKAAVVSKRAAHASCRGLEDGLRKTEQEKETEQTNAADAAYLAKPACLSTQPEPGPLETNLQKALAWGNAHHATLQAANTAKATATTNANAKATVCDAAQTAFESAFCSYRSAMGTACSTHTQCVDEKTTYRTNLKPKIQVKEDAEKIIWKTCKKVRCYIELIEESVGTAITAAQFSTCKGAEATTGNLDVTYGEDAAGEACVDPTGLAAWETSGYVYDKATFISTEYTSLAPANTWSASASAGIEDATACS